MPIIDLVDKCIQNQYGSNMSLYCDDQCKLKVFSYNQVMYEIIFYETEETTYLITFNDGSQYRIPQMLTVYKV